MDTSLPTGNMRARLREVVACTLAGTRRLAIAAAVVAGGCSDDAGLDDYFPALPPPTGGPQQVFAGEVTDPAQLVTGPAASGMVGDFYIKNDRVSFIVQAPTRVVGVLPHGGNVVDAVLTDGATSLVDDHFGELGLLYLVGRTCEPDRVEIVRDGAKGGVAALRAIGRSANNDFVNLKGIGVFPVDPAVDPDGDDGILCATTYVLAPGSNTLEVYHSLFNSSRDKVTGPLGTLADVGGDTDAWTNTRGFERSGLASLGTLGSPQPSDYVVYQGPGVAYGLIPRHAKPTTHAHVSISGISFLFNGTSALLEILQRDKYFLDLPAKRGLMQRYDLVVGRDASDVDAVWRAHGGEALQTVTGRVQWSDGSAAVGARVGVFVDGNGNGVLDDATVDLDGDGQPDDHAVSYMDVAADGSFRGQVSTTAGVLFARADVKDVGRSASAVLADGATFVIPVPVKVDFQIVDAATSQPMPGRLVVVGEHPAPPDHRVFETYDRTPGAISGVHAIRGTTVDLGDGADPALVVPAGGTYRIYASRGTEWSVASHPVAGTANVDLTFTLTRVVPTPGYLATDWHVHQVGSFDSPVLSEERIRSAVSAGIELFAVTDHDYVSDLQPVVAQLGLARAVRVLPGLEVTPFAYGHYNAWPITPDPLSPNRGAIDWGLGATTGLAMLPAEIYSAMRARGARIVQVNHARAKGFKEFLAAFSRANVKYDYDNRTIFGDYMNASTPNDWMRLPEESLWSDQFNGLEVWNGFEMVDSNGDKLRENVALDRTLRDWLSMLSFGFYVLPTGNSDTHTSALEPMGMPRTYVRVADDTPAALENGSAVDAVLATQTGSGGAARDVVITSGPMIDVRSGGVPALGRMVTSIAGPVTLDVTITSADWAEFDTLEVFANSTPAAVGASDITVLTPLKCWTSRQLGSLDANDPCRQAGLAPEAMTVSLVTLPGGAARYQATVQVTLDAADIGTRAGASGRDAWLVFRARGDRGIFPLLADADSVTPATLPALLSGDMAAIRSALAGRGPHAAAVTAPVFVDFDGGGYRAPFAP